MRKNSEFAVHRLNNIGLEKANLISDIFDYCLNSISQLCIDSREFNIAKTKLEEACFFAKKAMALNLNNQELLMCAEEYKAMG